MGLSIFVWQVSWLQMVSSWCRLAPCAAVLRYKALARWSFENHRSQAGIPMNTVHDTTFQGSYFFAVEKNINTESPIGL